MFRERGTVSAGATTRMAGARCVALSRAGPWHPTPSQTSVPSASLTAITTTPYSASARRETPVRRVGAAGPPPRRAGGARAVPQGELRGGAVLILTAGPPRRRTHGEDVAECSCGDCALGLRWRRKEARLARADPGGDEVLGDHGHDLIPDQVLDAQDDRPAGHDPEGATDE